MNYNSVSSAFTNALPVAIQQNYAHAKLATVACGTAGVVVAAEMAIRAIFDGLKLLSNRHPGESLETLQYNFSANLGGAVFYGLCAANILPGTPVIGAAIFAIYSITKDLKEDDYLTTKFLSHTFTLITDALDYVGTKIIGPILKPIVELLIDVIEKIAEVVLAILRVIPLPEHPVWIATGILVTAIVVVKVALPALRVV
jgi:hypothetical protein